MLKLVLGAAIRAAERSRAITTDLERRPIAAVSHELDAERETAHTLPHPLPPAHPITAIPNRAGTRPGVRRPNGTDRR